MPDPPQEPPAPRPVEGLQPWRLLFVDDSPTCCELLILYLGLYAPPWQVTCVTTIDDACGSIAAAKPDILLLDLHLRESTGANTLQQMLHAAPGIPIVIVSGTDSHLQDPAIIATGVGYAKKNMIDEDTPGFITFLVHCWATWHVLDQEAPQP